MDCKLHLPQPQADKKDVEAMGFLHRKLTMLHAPKGSGKSTLLAGIGKKMKMWLKKEIVVIDASLDFNPKTFGAFREITIAQFQEQLELFSILVEIMTMVKQNKVETELGAYLQAKFPKASKENIELFLNIPSYLDIRMLKQGILGDTMAYITAVKAACQTLGIYLYDSVQFIDEAMSASGRRRAMTNRNAMFNEYYSKMRHMLSTVIVTLPDKKMFDSYGMVQLDWRGKVEYDECCEEVTARFIGKWNWSYVIYQPLYRKYFNSYNALGFHSGSLGGIRPETVKLKDFSV